MFVHLRNHSHFSLLKALPKVSDLIKEAKKSGMSAVALTDYSNMYGTIEFYSTCKKEGIKPIIGAEFTIFVHERRFQIVLLVKDLAGYKNLMRITSLVNIDNPIDPVLTDKILLEHKEGLVVLSGGLWGDVSSLLVIDEDLATKRLAFYKDNFEGSYYLEVNPQTNVDDSNIMRAKTIEIAKKTSTPLVATWNTHYLHIQDKQAQKILYLVNGEEHSLDEYNHLFQKDVFAFETGAGMSVFDDIPEALENTLKIADMCTVEIPLGQWVFPAIEYTKSYNEDLKELAYAGLPIRNLELTEAVKTRLEYELKVIADKGYSPYFLVVYDLLRYARENNILTNIRGSVAGSLVTYLLQVTKCDPLSYKLPFERFLNPERPSAPDIDMDYADTRRDEVIDYARRKYGIDNVAQIGTFGTMMARGAVRDVARAMKYPYMVGDRISKMIPPPKQGFPVTIAGALLEIPELKEIYDTDRETQEILDMAQKVEGCARHISVHAAGTVISPRPLWDFTPIQKDPKGGKVITQYDMYTIEDAGLLKFDFLGIRNLTILGDAIALTKERYDVTVDIENISLEDGKTFSMLARGETMGLFQLNGSGMTRFLKELKPTTIFDINAMVALYRPGPLEMIPEYIRRKHDPSLVTFLDPRLEPILDQSFGVIVYQDDVMLIAIHLAGYSWLEADKLRKAMGKKIPAEMQAQKEKLLQGFLQEHGLSRKKRQELWSLIEPFAAYGFNKAHAASYGRVAYQTAYMKANFPVAYMTAILTNESGDVEKIAEIVSECKRMGIIVLPPDINESEGGFSVVFDQNGKEEIRFGLYTVKNLGVDISDAIIAERKKAGGFYFS
jgi:DNA polymerase-3 subunit alpha